MTPWNDNFVDNAFTYHEPKDGQPEMYAAIRAKAGELAALVCELCPGTAETMLALRKVQEAVMWANASIALDEHVTEVKAKDETNKLSHDAREKILQACSAIEGIAWVMRDQNLLCQHSVLRSAARDIREELGE